MSEFRNALLESGACLEERVTLFDTLDRGDGDANDFATAQEYCKQCPELQDCRARIGESALILANLGVKDTVLAGMVFESRLPAPPTPEAEVEQPPTLALFLDPHTSLEAVRGLLNADQKAQRWLANKLYNLPSADYAETRLALASLSDKEATMAKKWLVKTFCYGRDLMEASEDPSWAEIDERERFEIFVDTYFKDVAALQAMGVPASPRRAFYFSPEWHRKLFAQYAHHDKWLIHRLLKRAKDCRPQLERIERRTNWFTEQYHDHPELKPFIVRQIADSTAGNEDDQVFINAIERYLREHQLLAQQSARFPFLTAGKIRSLLKFYGSADKAVEQLGANLAKATELAKTYKLRPSEIINLCTFEPANLEKKMQRFRNNLRMLGPLLDDPDFSAARIRTWAFYYPTDPTKHVKKYIDALAQLRKKYSNDDDFDETSIRMLARMHAPLEYAPKYKSIYHHLQEQFANDDYIEAWMLRIAAAQYTSPFKAVQKLRRAYRLGYVRLSLDAPLLIHDNGDTFALHDILSDSSDPQDEFIKQENILHQRVRIKGALLHLPKPERSALCYAFGLDWLLEDIGIDLLDICTELSIKPAEFEQYVKEVIIPKIDAEKLKELS